VSRGAIVTHGTLCNNIEDDERINMYGIIEDNRRSVTGIDKIQISYYIVYSISRTPGGRVPPREAVPAAANGRRGNGNGPTVARALNI